MILIIFVLASSSTTLHILTLFCLSGGLPKFGDVFVNLGSINIFDKFVTNCRLRLLSQILCFQL